MASRAVVSPFPGRTGEKSASLSLSRALSSDISRAQGGSPDGLIDLFAAEKWAAVAVAFSLVELGAVWASSADLAHLVIE